MYQSINRIVEELKTNILTWGNVVCVTRMPLSSQIQDIVPVVKMDVYYRGILTGCAQRQLSFTPCDFFETSEIRKKDRFFKDNIPVHLDYKSIERIESLTQEIMTRGVLAMESSTYGLYRIVHSLPITEDNSWLDGIRDTISRLSGDFWKAHRQNLETRLEHLVADLGQSELLDNQYLYIQASSRFLETLVEYLYTVNCEFMPSPELCTGVSSLETLPSGFAGTYDLLLREGAMDKSRRTELARKLLNQLRVL